VREAVDVTAVVDQSVGTKFKLTVVNTKGMR
jgi:hypothetical protein